MTGLAAPGLCMPCWAVAGVGTSLAESRIDLSAPWLNEEERGLAGLAGPRPSLARILKFLAERRADRSAPQRAEGHQTRGWVA